MKILFLDCDGVINSEEGMYRGLFKTDFPVDSYMAFLVGKIQLETDCKVVLSSAWRHDKESVDRIHKQIVPIYDITPDNPTGVHERGHEIKTWLANAKYKIEKYAILDDDSDMLPEQLPNFFKTDWKTGLTDEIALKVIQHLNG